jgi:hypothetical protein
MTFSGFVSTLATILLIDPIKMRHVPLYDHISGIVEGVNA